MSLSIKTWLFRTTKNSRYGAIFARLQSTNINQPSNNSSNFDQNEIDFHNKIAKDWWDKDGVMRGLHSFNEIRVPFIRNGLIATKLTKKHLIETSEVLEDVNILEVGCGGGILSEQLARLQANVTGIDLGKDVIATALKHLKEESCNLSERLNYKVESVEDHAKENSCSYDAVVLSEVIEHVTDKIQFLSCSIECVKPGGSVFITTPNRTIPMLIGGVFLAENVLNIVPKGTHDWQKFITPLELRRMLDTLNCTTILTNGCTYKPWNNQWEWTTRTDFCYVVQAVKN